MGIIGQRPWVSLLKTFKVLRDAFTLFHTDQRHLIPLSCLSSGRAVDTDTSMWNLIHMNNDHPSTSASQQQLHRLNDIVSSLSPP